jgi:hypothetical protein
VPRIVGTGLEDYFLGGWYFREGPFIGPYHGVPVKDTLNASVAMYRVHEADAIRFQERLKFAFVNQWSPDTGLARSAFRRSRFFTWTERRGRGRRCHRSKSCFVGIGFGTRTIRAFPKPEIRNPKSETNPKFEAGMFKTRAMGGFRTFEFRISRPANS